MALDFSAGGMVGVCVGVRVGFGVAVLARVGGGGEAVKVGVFVGADVVGFAGAVLEGKGADNASWVRVATICAWIVAATSVSRAGEIPWVGWTDCDAGNVQALPMEAMKAITIIKEMRRKLGKDMLLLSFSQARGVIRSTWNFAWNEFGCSLSSV